MWVNQLIDAEEHLEQMCPKCQSDATSHKCIRCGKPLGAHGSRPDLMNPNFDTERFAALSNDGTEQVHDENNDEDIDYDLIKQIQCRSEE